MQKAFNRNFSYALFRATSATILGLLTIKIVATYGGAAQLGYFAQWQAFLILSATITSSVAGTGLVKYVAENFKKSLKKSIEYLQSGLVLSLLFSFILSLISILFWKSILIFIGLENSQSIFILSAPVFIVLYALNAFMQSYENAVGNVGRLTFYVFVSNFISFILILIGALFFDSEEIFILFFLGPAVTFILLIVFYLTSLRRLDKDINYFFRRNNFHKSSETKNLINFSFMPIISLLSSMGLFILVRNEIGAYLDWESVGLWSGLKKISDSFISMIAILMTTYYVPALAKATGKTQINFEVIYLAKRIIPLSFIILSGIYLMRHVIILLIFSEEFIQIEPLFLWQFLGDFLKVCSFVFSYVFLAKAMVSLVVILEVCFVILFWMTFKPMMVSYGILGLAFTHFIVYSCYLITCMLLYYLIYRR